MKCSCGHHITDPKQTHCKLCGSLLDRGPQGHGEHGGHSGSGTGRMSSQERHHVIMPPAGKPWRLTEGELFTFGRDAGASVTVPSKRVSRMHAEIFWRAGFPVIRNLSGQNTTLVNGRPISEHELREKDEITVGPFSCVYRIVANLAALEAADGMGATIVESGATMEGSLGEMNLASLLTSFERQESTGTLDLRRGAEDGTIVLQKGRCNSAQYGSLSGQKALFALLEWRDGTYSFAADVISAPKLNIMRKFDYQAEVGGQERDLKKIPISKLLEQAERERRGRR